MDEFRRGHLEVICGPMFSGKSEELMRRMRRVQISGKNFLIIKPSVDTRYSNSSIVSHDMRSMEAVVVGTDKAELLEFEDSIINSEAEVIAFDEINFFDDYLVDVVKKCVSNGKRVIISGMDMDFRGEPFDPMPKLLSMADHVDKLKAICMKCKCEPASLSQRLVNGEAASRSDPLILIGGKEHYEPRCRRCHEVRE